MPHTLTSITSVPPFFYLKILASKEIGYNGVIYLLYSKMYTEKSQNNNTNILIPIQSLKIKKKIHMFLPFTSNFKRGAPTGHITIICYSFPFKPLTVFVLQITIYLMFNICPLVLLVHIFWFYEVHSLINSVEVLMRIISTEILHDAKSPFVSLYLKSAFAQYKIFGSHFISLSLLYTIFHFLSA